MNPDTWRYVPLEPNTKKPNMPDWETRPLLGSETDPACRGIHLGASRLIVLDEDATGALAAWQAVYGKLPQTAVIRTRKGVHVVYRVPEGESRPLRSHIAHGGFGLDLLAGARQIVAPGATADGVTRVWMDEHSIIDAPGFVVDLVVDDRSERERAAVEGLTAGGYPVPVAPLFDPSVAPADHYMVKLEAKIAAIRALSSDARPAGGFRQPINDAALMAGGLLHTERFTWEQARAGLESACAAVWGSVDDEDQKWIEDGLHDGAFKKPIPVRQGTPMPEISNFENPSEPGAESQGFNFEFLDPKAVIEPPSPAVYGGFGGLPLFYERGVHWLQGESESGKSLIALAGPVLDAVRSGGLVLYVDHESTRGDIQERLQQLGATDEEVGRVCYVPAADVEHSTIVAHLVNGGRRYAVMVVDGVTSALSAAEMSGRDEQELTRWVDSLPRRARMSVCIDHVVKAMDQRNGMAIGSQAKKSVVTGAAYEVECTEKFGRGASGQIVIRMQKDKPGWVRGAQFKYARLIVSSAPNTYALSVRVATGAAAVDPLERWLRDQIAKDHGAWAGFNGKDLVAAIRAAGGPVGRNEGSVKSDTKALYERLLTEDRVSAPGIPNDPFARVPESGTGVGPGIGDPMILGTDEMPDQSRVPDSGTQLGLRSGPGSPTFIGGDRGTLGPESGDTSSFFGVGGASA